MNLQYAGAGSGGRCGELSGSSFGERYAAAVGPVEFYAVVSAAYNYATNSLLLIFISLSFV